MAYLLARCGPTEKVKLMKLLYLADRHHFVERGVPITGDRLVAMQWGPLPSKCLDIVNGNPGFPPDQVFGVIHVEDTQVAIRHAAIESALSDTEKLSLDWVISGYGHMAKWAIVEATHDLPEYKENFREGTATTISFESIAKYSGNDRRFLNGRLIVSVDAAHRLEMPYSAADQSL